VLGEWTRSVTRRVLSHVVVQRERARTVCSFRGHSSRKLFSFPDASTKFGVVKIMYTVRVACAWKIRRAVAQRRHRSSSKRCALGWGGDGELMKTLSRRRGPSDRLNYLCFRRTVLMGATGQHIFSYKCGETGERFHLHVLRRQQRRETNTRGVRRSSFIPTVFPRRFAGEFIYNRFGVGFIRHTIRSRQSVRYRHLTMTLIKTDFLAV